VNHAAATPLNVPLLTAQMEQARPASPAVLALTVGLARGDDSAWTTFHREYGPAIFRQLLAATRGDHDLASEALQQTYLRVARHARACDLEAMFLGWLRVVARSALSDCRRRRRSFWEMLRRRAQEPDAGCSDERSDDQLQIALEIGLAALSPDDRALLEAKYFHGQTVRAIAERLCVSSKAIESRLTRARGELRRQISHCLPRDE
jgi:RNA polymerase sigma factor (sigma-70 family)